MGAPVGNQNAARAKVWQAAILRALDKRSGGDRVKALEQLAGKLLDAVETGDLAAIKELGDRLDGKPHQSVDAELRGSLTHALESLPVIPPKE